MESVRLEELVHEKCVGFFPIVSGAALNDIDISFFLRNPICSSQWINTLLALSAESDKPINDKTFQETEIPLLDGYNLVKLGNSPLKLPVLTDLSLQELAKLNVMSIAIAQYVVKQDNWSPEICEMVHNLGLDGLEAKVCLYFINEVIQADPRSLSVAPQAEVKRAITKIVQLYQQEQIQEMELLPLCANIGEGIWSTKQALGEVQSEVPNLTIKSTQLLKIRDKIFELEQPRIDELIKPIQTKEGLQKIANQFDPPLFAFLELYWIHHQKKKKDTINQLNSFLEKEVLTALKPPNEDFFLEICQLAAISEEYDFLLPVVNNLGAHIQDGTITLQPKNHIKIRSWMLIPNLLPSFTWGRDPQEDNRVFGRIEATIEQFKDELEFHSDLVSLYGKLIVKLSIEDPNYHVKLESLVSALPVPLALAFLQSINQEIRRKEETKLKRIGGEISNLFAQRISIESLAIAPTRVWESFLNTLQEVGIATIPEDFFQIDSFNVMPLSRRFELVNAIILGQKLKYDDKLKKTWIKLVSIDPSEKEEFYTFKEISSTVLMYFLNYWIEDPSQPIPEFILLNKKAILDICLKFQLGKVPTPTIFSLFRSIPPEIYQKLMSEPDTRAILRLHLQASLLDKLVIGDYQDLPDGLNLIGSSFADLIEPLEVISTNIILSSRGNRDLLSFLQDLQSNLLEEQASDIIIQKVASWLKLWSLVNKAAKGDQWQYPVALLDIIEESPELIDPQYIFNQILDLMKPKEIQLHIENKAFGAWLEAVKQGYFKLRSITNNFSIAMQEKTREQLHALSDELLAFTIKTRRENLIQNIKGFSVNILDYIALESKFVPNIPKTIPILFPEPYFVFATPALRVLNEILHEPMILPLSGSGDSGLCVYPDYWVFTCALTFCVGFPVIVGGILNSDEYSDYSMNELIRTFSLAMKKAEPLLKELDIPRLPRIDSEVLVVEYFKQLTTLHAQQFSPEQIEEALVYGGWDPAIRKRIIEKKTYCLYCSFELSEADTTCSNCGKTVEEIDLASLSFDQIQLDLGEVGEMETTTSEAPPEPVTTQDLPEPVVEEPSPEPVAPEESAMTFLVWYKCAVCGEIKERMEFTDDRNIPVPSTPCSKCGGMQFVVHNIAAQVGRGSE